PVPEPELPPGDRLRRPRSSVTPVGAPVDRRPGRDEVLRAVDRRERARSKEAGGFRAFARGAVRHCPRCGGGRLFTSWFKIRERCPRCGFRLEREEGGFLGAMTFNYAITAVIWLAVFIVWLVVDLPDVRVFLLTVVSISIAVVVPLLFWPISKTLWAAVDYLVTQTETAHIPDEVRPPDY
ncbi:MAG TPA: DUF983 domain-containing protein, partial [Actinomycetota bacterium]|nr:DUF983 domain-containing protein [Actinomycetota bacterium]